MIEKVHIPVLLEESLQMLNLKYGMKVADGTVGLGGHAEHFLKNIGNSGKLLAIDADEDNLQYSQDRLKLYGSVVCFYHGNYSEIQEAANKFNFSSFDAIFLDLGLASVHVDQAERGFSFMRDGRLDMRFDQTQKLTAAAILNFYSFDNLVRIFRQYGQEQFARKIAQRIVESRKKVAFQTTFQLVDLIVLMKPKRERIHPATKVFQALRIEVNHELEHLQRALIDSIELLAPRGRMVVISYHSLEDRIVKNIFRFYARACICPQEALKCQCSGRPTLKILTKKPIVPSSEEIGRNTRSRSAKLRAVEKI